MKLQKALTHHSQVRNLILFYLLVFSCLVPVDAISLQQELNKMLNTLSSSSDPAAYQTQRRGVISGGAFHARNRINETNLTGIVPPEFSAGCGGIDLYGGSFSFINSEQFNKLIRDIAGNASGYLLGLAISAMNEKAYQHIEALQEKIMHLNSLFSNSCQMGQGLVNSMPMPAAMKKFQTDASLNISRANVADTFQSFTGTGLSNRDPVKAWRQSASPQDQEKMLGNLVWNALKKSSAITGNEYREAVMSLTGTIIVSMESGDTQPRLFSYVGNQLKVEDLIYGSDKVSLYRCHNHSACLSMTLMDKQKLSGLSEHLTQLLNALADHWHRNAKDSLLTVNGVSAPALLQNLPAGIGAMIRNLTAADVQLAKLFITQAAPHIAFYMVHQFMEDLHHITVSLVNMEGDYHPFAQQLQDTLKSSKTQLHQELQRLGERYGRFGELIQDYRHMLAVAEQKRYQRLQLEPNHYQRYQKAKSVD
ncbi:MULTISPECIES: conjugal transfer protein TraH [unclassified Endozoicomonas]|uniref:conjugal transfer protein TraH n=1 Tax=unclassified Endozoicomonas TaxID=2644528 RepID=UPI003BB4BDA0